MVCSRHPLDPKNFTVFASEVGPPYTYTVSFRVVSGVASVEVLVILVVAEPAARAVFAYVDERNPEFGYVHIQSSILSAFLRQAFMKFPKL